MAKLLIKSERVLVAKLVSCPLSCAKFCGDRTSHTGDENISHWPSRLQRQSVSENSGDISMWNVHI